MNSCWLDLIPSFSVLYASLWTFCHGLHSRNLWHISLVFSWSKPILGSSFGTPLRGCQGFPTTRIRLGCFGDLVRQDGSPFCRTPFVCSYPLSHNGSCALESAYHVGLVLINLCFLVEILFPRMIGSKTCGHLAHCFLVGRDFLLPTVSPEGRKRREDSPLQGWLTLLRQTKVLGHWGIFALFHRR